MLPTTAAVDVDSPPNDRASPVRMTGHEEERLVSDDISIDVPRSDVTLPPEYVRPEENVVVATHVGPEDKLARMNPFVPREEVTSYSLLPRVNCVVLALSKTDVDEAKREN